MDLRKISGKKSLKLLLLLVTSMIITTASATVYYGLTMEPRVTVTGLTVTFTSGDDTPAGSTVQDEWCRLLLKSYPNATLTYDQAVNLTNTDGSNAHSVRLRHISITPDGSSYVGGNFTSIKFYLLNAAGTEQTSFAYTNNGTHWTTPPTTGYYSIPAGNEWTIKAETLSSSGATVGTDCDIQIAVDVEE